MNNNVVKSIIDDVEKWIESDVMIPLHHYVKDANALQLIVCHKQLRLSKFDQMRNDPKEFRFASEVFSQCIDNLQEEEKINEHDASKLKESVEYTDEMIILKPDHKRRIISAIPIPIIPYVACFSPWERKIMANRYGNVALNITNPEIIFQSIYNNKPDWISYIKFVRVVYDSEQVRDKIKELIMNAKGAGEKEDWYHLVHTILMKCSLALKSSEFADEEEYRLVYFRPKNLDINDPALDYICPSHFEMENGKIVNKNNELNDDRYVWMDFSLLLTGVTVFDGELDVKKLKELAGREDFIIIKAIEGGHL